jgi:hypothetical protein
VSTAINSLIDGDGYLMTPDPGAPPTDNNSAATVGASMGPAPHEISALQGTPPLTGSHNTPLHVGFIGLVALGIVILLRVLGFAGFGVSATGGVRFGRG